MEATSPLVVPAARAFAAAGGAFEEGELRVPATQAGELKGPPLDGFFANRSRLRIEAKMARTSPSPGVSLA
jgi:hypothetical protein